MPPAITGSNMPKNVIRLMYSHRIFASGAHPPFRARRLSYPCRGISYLPDDRRASRRSIIGHLG
jgi:hypothetical protein